MTDQITKFKTLCEIVKAARVKDWANTLAQAVCAAAFTARSET